MLEKIDVICSFGNNSRLRIGAKKIYMQQRVRHEIQAEFGRQRAPASQRVWHKQQVSQTHEQHDEGALERIQ
jgi:hypothetical protein